MRKQNDQGNRSVEVFLFIMLFIAVAFFSQMATSSGPGPNYRNYTIDTKVNITSPPVVQSVILQNPITLTAGTITTITCNASIRDFNGFADIKVVNATLFIPPSTLSSANDNNTKYFNSSCNAISGQQSGFIANYSCSFPVNYYAVNGSWNCTVQANDTTNLVGVGSNTTIINALLALNVTPTLLDYGILAPGSYSPNMTANITNFGNVPINISVQGYGAIIGDNLSFVCDHDNLTIDIEHFAGNNTANWATMQNLTSSFQSVFGLSINKSVNGTQNANATYWALYINDSQTAAGLCNGSIIFQAEAS